MGQKIDLCLFNCSFKNISKSIYETPESYIGLGELKGGIDPAGADEHWKTARSALQRVRASFAREGLCPNTFFVGAAIVRNMSEEIWKQLEGGILKNAANLTNENQLNSLCRWLTLL